MSLSKLHHPRHRSAILTVLAALVLSVTPILMFTTQVYAANNHSTTPLNVNHKGIHYSFALAGQAPPSDAVCRATAGVPCYSPQEIQRAYGVTPLLRAGYTGKGQTIVIIDSFGSPTIVNDLHVFDTGYGLPDPPSLKILAPLGTIKFDPTNNDMVGWAFETTLDVEWAHAMAPAAKIVLMTSPVSETEGVQGLPEFLYLEQYAYKHHLGQIISQSWGATENTLFTPGGRQVLNNFNKFFEQATDAGWSVFASSGDSGSANVDINGNFYPFPTVIFPASSPYVTAVGGTSLYASTKGVYDHETVWNNSIGASGGGISQYFREPGYQKRNLPSSNQVQLKGRRGIPDISWNADPNTSILVYIGFLGGSNNGYYFIGGTSEGAPQWAGITADADQWAGEPQGLLNNALYRLGKSSNYSRSFHDITVGNNSFAGVPGYNATNGWDLATGWGTPKAANMFSEILDK